MAKYDVGGPMHYPEWQLPSDCEERRWKTFPKNVGCNVRRRREDRRQLGRKQCR